MFVPGEGKGSVSFHLKDLMADLLIGGCVRVQALMDLLSVGVSQSRRSCLNSTSRLETGFAEVS